MIICPNPDCKKEWPEVKPEIPIESVSAVCCHCFHVFVVVDGQFVEKQVHEYDALDKHMITVAKGLPDLPE